MCEPRKPAVEAELVGVEHLGGTGVDELVDRGHEVAGRLQRERVVLVDADLVDPGEPVRVRAVERVQVLGLGLRVAVEGGGPLVLAQGAELAPATARRGWPGSTAPRRRASSRSGP